MGVLAVAHRRIRPMKTSE